MKYRLTKDEAVEEFDTVKELEQWALDCFDKYIAESYKQVLEDSDGQTGYEDYRDWFRDADMDELVWTIEDNGWSIGTI